MSVRTLAVALGAVSLAVLLAVPASARCMIEPFDNVVQESDTVWWGTVTDAAASKRTGPGTWTLTIHLDDVLKGQGTQGATDLVFVSGCGPYISPEAAKEEAARFVGQTRLFIGNHGNSGLVAFSEVLSPQGLSPQQQHQRALADLGLPAPSPSPGATGPGAIAPGRFSWGGVAVAVAILISGAVIFLCIRRGART
jgi:hypothetical protein